MKLRQSFIWAVFTFVPIFVNAQSFHLGLPKDSVEILYPMSEKTDQGDDIKTYFDLRVDDVNWNGTNGRLHLKFDSVDKVKGLQWATEMSPKAATVFIRDAIKHFGKPESGDKLPISTKASFAEWSWADGRTFFYLVGSKTFGSLSYEEGQTSNGKLTSPNDINANEK